MTFVALAGSEILGWCWGYQLIRPDDSSMLYLHQLEVDETHRRKANSAHKGEPVSCSIELGGLAAADCGCGVGLERCLPGTGLTGPSSHDD